MKFIIRVLVLSILSANALYAQSSKPSPEESLIACPTDPKTNPETDVPRKRGSLTQAPQLIHRAKVHYSKEGRKQKIEGVSVISLTVSKEGLPTDLCVATPLGYGLDEEAAKTVRQYRFTPGIDHGTPVPVRVNVEVKFSLW